MIYGWDWLGDIEGKATREKDIAVWYTMSARNFMAWLAVGYVDVVHYAVFSYLHYVQI